MNEHVEKAPVHFWIVAIVSLLWNAVGGFDYVATQYGLEFYMSQFSEEQMAYFEAFPAWMVACWAVGVWGALLGSLCLLIRKSWAVALFAASVLGLAASTVYNFGMTDGAEIMGTGGVVFTGVIWAIALFLLFYSRAMSKRGVLQ